MNIKSLLDKYAPNNVTAAMDYPGAKGFKLTLEYMPETKLQKAVERSKRPAWERHQRRDVTDDATFRAEMAAHVLDWEGLTPAVLASMGLVKLDAVPEDARHTPIPYSKQDAVDLMGDCPSFGSWVLDTVTNPDVFPLVEETENLSDGPSGGHDPAA